MKKKIMGAQYMFNPKKCLQKMKYIIETFIYMYILILAYTLYYSPHPFFFSNFFLRKKARICLCIKNASVLDKFLLNYNQ